MPDIFYRMLSKCTVSQEERKSLIPLIQQMADYSEKARKEGLKSLETEIVLLNPGFLKYGLTLCLDNRMEEFICLEILIKWIIMRKFSGKTLMEHLMILSALKSIYHGENCRILKDKLYCFLGDEIFELYQNDN